MSVCNGSTSDVETTPRSGRSPGAPRPDLLKVSEGWIADAYVACFIRLTWGRGTTVSSSACIVYVGVRYEVSPDELEDLECKTDPRQLAAKRVGLRSYWGNFGGENERNLLFIGTEIAVLGEENGKSVGVAPSRLADIISNTERALAEGAFKGQCALFAEWLQDA